MHSYTLSVYLILLLYYQRASCFNVKVDSDHPRYFMSMITKKTGRSGHRELPDDQPSSFFGYNMQFYKQDFGNVMTLLLGSPKHMNPRFPFTQLAGPGRTYNATNAIGDVSTCFIPKSLFTRKDVTMCSKRYPKSPFPGDGIGLSMSLDAEGNMVTCPYRRAMDCDSSRYYPGYCYRSSNAGKTWRPAKQNIEFDCPVNSVDIIFVLDGSQSIGTRNFRKVKDWVLDVAERFNVNTGGNRVGIIQYSHYFVGDDPDDQPFMRTEVALGEVRTHDELKKRLLTVRLQNYTTYTAHALNKTVKDFESYGRLKDPSTKAVMILLTDGLSKDKDFLAVSSQYVRSRGIQTFAVGVGEADLLELRTVATGDTRSDDRVYKVGNFADLSSIVDSLQRDIMRTGLEAASSQEHNKLSMAESGISTKITENGRLYLGAVGAYDWSGTVTKYDTMDDTTADIPTYAEVQKVLPNRTKESYMGYSVTTGTFNDGTTEYVATGAPRYKLMGAVVIYKPLNNDNKFNDHVRLMGHPSKRRLGSYFGGSVLALDVNNDNRDDLLVGAPLYVNESYDEGRVFVYVSQTTNTLGEWAKNTYKPIELVGDNLPGGRFRTAIANAGDLNKDGYNDVIIGAPLVEGDRGAVFIYHGSADGVDPMFKQKILASQLTGVTLKYFGQSLQGAVDLDSNGYPDIAVGAPKSDTVVIFRSRPVVNIAATIGFAGTSAIDIFECILDKKYVNCTTIEVCFTPTGDSIEDQIGMKFNVSMDARKADAEKRLEFRDNNEKTGSAKFTWSSVVALKKSKQSCFTQQVHMKTNVKDYDASVIAEVEYDLTEAHTAVAMSSVRDPTKSNKQSASLNFTKNCVGTCDPDLNVVMTLNVPKYPTDAPPEKDLSKNKKVFVIHSEMAGTPLPVHVNLSNFGENAFDAKVRIKYTDVITLRNVVIRAANPPSNSCVVEDSSPADENGLRTQILRYNSRTNIMPSNTYCYFEFSLIMDPLRNNGSLDNFVVEVEAFISGSTKEKDTSNNHATRTTELDYISDMTLKQGATPDISFNDTTEDTRNITSITEIGNGTENAISTFTVTGNGYSNIPNVGVTLDFPMMTPDNEMLLYLYDVQCRIPNSNRRIACSCDMDQVNRYNLSLGAPQQSTENVSTTITPVSITKRNTPMDTYQYSCLNKNTTGCRTVSCRIKNLGQRDEVIFEAHYRVWTDSLMFNSSNINEKIELRSNFKITTSQSPNILDGNGVRPIVKTEESIINVRLFSANSGPAPVADNLWIYIVAAIGGLLLLIALVLILWKLGFFKSKYADMKKGAEEDLQEETEFPDQNGQ